MSALTDKQLMARLADGDLDAFNELVRRHQHTAWRLACRFLGDAAEAEDITQEAFLRILAAAPRYRPSAAFSTYLYRVVSRLCLDQARKKRPLCVDFLPEQAGRSPDPAAVLIQQDQSALVRGAVDALPPGQKMAVILKYYEGLSYDEIARALGKTVRAVEGLLGRARAALAADLARAGLKSDL